MHLLSKGWPSFADAYSPLYMFCRIFNEWLLQYIQPENSHIWPAQPYYNELKSVMMANSSFQSAKSSSYDTRKRSKGREKTSAKKNKIIKPFSTIGSARNDKS